MHRNNLTAAPETAVQVSKLRTRPRPNIAASGLLQWDNPISFHLPPTVPQAAWTHQSSYYTVQLFYGATNGPTRVILLS